LAILPTSHSSRRNRNSRKDPTYVVIATELLSMLMKGQGRNKDKHEQVLGYMTQVNVQRTLMLVMAVVGESGKDTSALFKLAHAMFTDAPK
jgi:hypothetical protein